MNDLIHSGSLGDKLGWSKSKVEALCRAKEVPYLTSKGKDGVSYYTILSEEDFMNAVKAVVSTGKSVTALEKERLNRDKGHQTGAEKRKGKKKTPTKA